MRKCGSLIRFDLTFLGKHMLVEFLGCVLMMVVYLPSPLRGGVGDDLLTPPLALKGGGGGRFVTKRRETC